MTGVLFAIVSAVLSTSKDLVSKKLAGAVDATLSTFASFLFALPYYVILLAVLWLLGYESFELSWHFFLLVILRSITDTGAELCKMHAFSHADISLVTPILALYPLLLLAASPLITGDSITAGGTAAVLLTVAGSLVLVLKPGVRYKSGQIKGILLAAACAFFFALNTCFDRLAVQRSSPALSGFAMTALSALFLLPMTRKAIMRPQLTANAGAFLSRGFFEVGFMVAKLSALQYLQAPYVVGIQKISVLLSIFGGKVFFKEEDFLRRLIAGMLVFSGVLLIIFL